MVEPPSADGIPNNLVAALLFAITALAGVIAYLFRHFTNRIAELDTDRQKHDAEVAKERAQWAVDRAQLSGSREEIANELRLEFEAKHRQALQDHITTIREIFEAARENENTARREYTANMEFISRTAADANEKIGTVLERFYDRLASTRRPPHGKG
jgi:biopolymer transport protein ExbB/TolQ